MKKRFKMVQVEEFYAELSRERLMSLRSAMRGGNAANDTVQLLNHVAKVLKGHDDLASALRERAQFLQAGIDVIDNILDEPVLPCPQETEQ
jgi:hypothetical protein